MFSIQSVLIPVCYPTTVVQVRLLLCAAVLNQHHSLIRDRYVGEYQLWQRTNRGMDSGVSRHRGTI
jgi:hypothetical protein